MLIYDGNVELSFSEGAHKYLVSKRVGDDIWLPAQPVTGVTTITSIIDKPSLMLWPLREAMKVLDGYKGQKLTKLALDDAYGAHKAKSAKGKAAGTIGHAMVEALLLGKAAKMPTDPERLAEAQSVRDAFELWRTEYEPKPLHTEQKFYSLAYDFAGTCDLVAEIGGKTVIIDYKTTNPSYHNPDGLYAENFAQVGGYAVGIEEMLGIEIDDAWLVNLPKNGEPYKIKKLSDMGKSVEEAKLYFLYCLGLFNAHKDFAWRLNK